MDPSARLGNAEVAKPLKSPNFLLHIYTTQVAGGSGPQTDSFTSTQPSTAAEAGNAELGESHAAIHCLSELMHFPPAHNSLARSSHMASCSQKGPGSVILPCAQKGKNLLMGPFSDTRDKTLFWERWEVLQLQGAQAWRYRGSFCRK